MTASLQAGVCKDVVCKNLFLIFVGWRGIVRAHIALQYRGIAPTRPRFVLDECEENLDCTHPSPATFLICRGAGNCPPEEDPLQRRAGSFGENLDCTHPLFRHFFDLSGCRELNPDCTHPKGVDCRYPTPR